MFFRMLGRCSYSVLIQEVRKPLDCLSKMLNFARKICFPGCSPSNLGFQRFYVFFFAISIGSLQLIISRVGTYRTLSLTVVLDAVAPFASPLRPL